MKRISRYRAPPSLHRSGLRTVSEVVPFEGEFRIAGAGKRLAQLFGKEVRQLMAARAGLKKESNA